jgi:GNAT superfamily N-acetyltransferase
MIEIRPVRSAYARRLFLTFPYRIYQHDPLWVPPLLSERSKMIDPRRGKFFQDGYADLFIAWKDGRRVGTIACAEDQTATQSRGSGEALIGFFECVDDFRVAEALFARATAWAREHALPVLHGTFNLDREDSRGLLIEGRERPPAVLCGHNPPYYPEFFERYGFTKCGEDNLAYALDLEHPNPEMEHMLRLADVIHKRKPWITVRSANLDDLDHEIDRVVELQNRGLAHMADYTPYTRASIEAMVLPMVEIIDPDLVLFAEVKGDNAGWFPAVPNLNEVLIHLNGLRYPWDALRALRYAHYQPKSLSVKSVVVPPEYWDSGVGVLIFAEMARRAVAKGYQWADLSLTGDENMDTWLLAHRMGAKIYKRYRFYAKNV